MPLTLRDEASKEKCKITASFRGEFQRGAVPGKWGAADKNKGQFWWVAQIMKYIFRLSPRMKQLVAEIRTKLRFRHPIIAMQVHELTIEKHHHV